MEAVFFEIPVVAFAAAYIGVLALTGVAAVIGLLYMAEVDNRGVRTYWAEWPLPERVAPEAVEEERIRLAA